MTQPVDILYRVQGDCLHSGHAWPLFGALCQCEADTVRDPEVRIGPITGTRNIGHGLLSISRQTQLRLRAPIHHLDALLRLTGQELRVGSHIVRLVDPVIVPLKPSSTLHVEVVTFSFAKPGSDRSTPPSSPTPGRDWWGNLREYLMTIAGYRGPITAGRRRKISLKGGHFQLGFPAEITGLTPDQSIAIQATPIGGRRHMGAGMFVSGALPKWLLGPTPQRKDHLQDSRCRHLPATFRRGDICSC